MLKNEDHARCIWGFCVAGEGGCRLQLRGVPFHSEAQPVFPATVLRAAVEWASDAHTPLHLDKGMGIDHRGAQVGVAEELLDGADVVAVLEQMSCERMAVMPGPA